MTKKIAGIKFTDGTMLMFDEESGAVILDGQVLAGKETGWQRVRRNLTDGAIKGIGTSVDLVGWIVALLLARHWGWI